MKDRLWIRFGAVTLALLTVAAVWFAVLNFQQRSSYVTATDGVEWDDSASGAYARHVEPGSPADTAGIKAGDRVLTVNGTEVSRATDVTRRLWQIREWKQVKYQLVRAGEQFEAVLITVPADEALSIENYLRVVGLLYLFIGLFIFARRWNAPRAVHFYLFCLTSFILYSFHYSGKLNEFDWSIYWSNVVALLLTPALLVHFALVF
ncbi:MAG TPA: PDZ domain-containing protein, partial [Verrucomicrobiae bacterium]|nr:PDZ domain-containing protein [Verrucomicrobiae bacterium]